MLTFQVIRVLILTGISFIVGLFLTPIVSKILYKYRAGKQIRGKEDAPIFNSLHQKKEGTPTMGGIIIWATVLGLAALFFILNLFLDGNFSMLNIVDRAQTYLPIAAMLIAALLGLVDDVLGIKGVGPKGGGLPMKYKILIYLLIALVGAYWFSVKLEWSTLYVPFFGNIEIDGWYIPLFIFVIVAAAFSANETDGLDGLLGGVSLFSFGSLAVVSFALGRFDLAAFATMVIGALLAFLWFNIHPARFFMGDTGSMALGITMGVIAMLTNTILFLPFFAPILVLESLSVIVQMISKKIFKRKIFISTPIHHHFEAIGWPESKVTMRFWIITVVSNGLGLVLFFLSRMIIR
ncbi:MAG TPA: phospho-N-acetylmuramoyl-pentapeptide-transferase [Candidatus Paceibacterota bacterium]|nr:phospho-N-acetylmuramoyl-pentapeptide-transferase [Candidatus Paceibacterota bacterium]